MALRRDAFLLTLGVALFVAATLVEGASAARKASELTSRRLSQLDELWSNGEMPGQAVLYSNQYFSGRSRVLRIGSHTLNNNWIRNAKSLWLPDGYKAVLWYGRQMVHCFNHAIAFQPDYLESASGTVPDDLEGRITRIDISRDLTWTERIVKDINHRRTRSKLGYISLNNKVSEYAYKQCQSDAHAGSFGKLNPHLSHELKNAGVYNKGVSVIRESGVRKAIDAVAKLYASHTASRSLRETRWVEMGVAYAKHHFGESTFYVCVILVEH